jgi:hypothetical protein
MSEDHHGDSGGSGGLGHALAICLLLAVGVLAYAAVPVNADKVGINERSAVRSLKSIQSAQRRFPRQAGDGSPGAASLSELAAEGLVDAELGSGTKSGYVFVVVDLNGNGGPAWLATAEPIVAGATGTRTFSVGPDGPVVAGMGPALAVEAED